MARVVAFGNGRATGSRHSQAIKGIGITAINLMTGTIHPLTLTPICLFPYLHLLLTHPLPNLTHHSSSTSHSSLSPSIPPATSHSSETDAAPADAVEERSAQEEAEYWAYYGEGCQQYW